MSLAQYLDIQACALEAQRQLHGRMLFRGLNISIENRAGSVRKGVGSNGKPWQVKMTQPYGYIRMSEGVDGDHVDCFVGPNENAANVYVIHIQDPATSTFDEDKCMLGFNTAAEAKACLLENYSNPKFFHSMDTIPFDEFKQKVLATKGNPQKLAACLSASAKGTALTGYIVNSKSMSQKCSNCKFYTGKPPDFDSAGLCHEPNVLQDSEVPENKKTGLKNVDGEFGWCREWEASK